ncbi:MAG: hypothetical protein IJ007_03680 [Oscillospiraceae bacterium]|nr:hypothetical protein [Oscillospiraceae bacterium]
MTFNFLNHLLVFAFLLTGIADVGTEQKMPEKAAVSSESAAEKINSDKLTAFIEEQIRLADENLKEVITEQPGIYMALCDIDDNGTPEIFLGSAVQTGINYCCYDTDLQPLFGFTGGIDRPFLDGRKYIGTDGTRYYRTVTYTGNPTYRGAVIYSITNKNGVWNAEYTETYDETEFETSDSFEILHFSEIQIDRNSIEESIQKCCYDYLNELGLK